jgi:hypothetical protein
MKTIRECAEHVVAARSKPDGSWDELKEAIAELGGALENQPAEVVGQNHHGPAFPFTPTDRSGQIGPSEPGMSLRAWLAGQALASMNYEWFDSRQRAGEMASEAIDIADRVIEALNRKEVA